MARLTLANMAADSGVLLGIIVVRSSFGIRHVPRAVVERTLLRTKATPVQSSDTSKDVPAGDKEEKAGDGSLLLSFGVLFVFALPVVAIVSPLPSGLLSAFIIFIGLHQAWKMTTAPPLQVSGPDRVGARPSAAAGRSVEVDKGARIGIAFVMRSYTPHEIDSGQHEARRSHWEQLNPWLRKQLAA